MGKETGDINHSLKFFSNLKSNDPKIIVKDNTIELIPFYGSFGLIINFIPILASIYIFGKQIDLTVKLLCIFATTISLFNMYYLLRYYNKIIIDLKERVIIIIPNFIFNNFKKEKNNTF